MSRGACEYLGVPGPVTWSALAVGIHMGVPSGVHPHFPHPFLSTSSSGS